ncbi:hypothetical protein [Roseivivax sp. CAU 1753]
MSVAAQVGIAVASVLTLLGLMALVRHVAQRRDVSAEVQRKLVHIGTGLYALCLPWLFTDRWPIFMLIGLTLAVMLVLRLPRVAQGGLGATLHGVERQSSGDILLALAVGTVFLLSDGRAILYFLPIAVLTLADAAAALTGTRYGRGFFQVEDGQKSVEGSVAFFTVTLILSMVCLLLLTDVDRAGVILLSIIVAAFGTLVEADSWRGFDNFFLPAGLLVFLESHMHSPPAELVALAVGFLLAIFAFLRAAPMLGLSAHAARVYVISIFLLISVTALENTVLPILIFVTHAISRKANPGSATHPELDIVAALALASFGWLVLGLVSGVNALWFYALMSMGICAGQVALALVPLPAHWRWLAAAVAGAGLVALLTALMAPGQTARDTAFASACAALMLAVPLLRPRAFEDRRAGKLTLLALVLPLGAYAWTVARAKGGVL